MPQAKQAVGDEPVEASLQDLKDAPPKQEAEFKHTQWYELRESERTRIRDLPERAYPSLSRDFFSPLVIVTIILNWLSYAHVAYGLIPFDWSFNIQRFTAGLFYAMGSGLGLGIVAGNQSRWSIAAFTIPMWTMDFVVRSITGAGTWGLALCIVLYPMFGWFCADRRKLLALFCFWCIIVQFGAYSITSYNGLYRALNAKLEEFGLEMIQGVLLPLVASGYGVVALELFKHVTVKASTVGVPMIWHTCFICLILGTSEVFHVIAIAKSGATEGTRECAESLLTTATSIIVNLVLKRNNFLTRAMDCVLAKKTILSPEMDILLRCYFIVPYVPAVMTLVMQVNLLVFPHKFEGADFAKTFSFWLTVPVYLTCLCLSDLIMIVIHKRMPNLKHESMSKIWARLQEPNQNLPSFQPEKAPQLEDTKLLLEEAMKAKWFQNPWYTDEVTFAIGVLMLLRIQLSAGFIIVYGACGTVLTHGQENQNYSC